MKILAETSTEYIWLKLDKKVFQLDEDLYVCFIYIPPNNSTFVNTGNLFNVLEQNIIKYNRLGKCIIMGDLNCHTHSEPDYVMFDTNPEHCNNLLPDDYVCDIPLHRNNQDLRNVNEHGKSLLEICKSTNMRIVNGRVLGDLFGSMTRFPNIINHSPGVLDYAIVHKSLFDIINLFQVHELTPYSDHCMISLQFNFYCDIEDSYNNVTDSLYDIDSDKFCWTSDSIPLFQQALLSKECASLIKNFSAINDNDNKDINKTCIDKCVSDLNNILYKAAECAKIPVKILNTGNKKRRKRNKPWFNRDCASALRCLKSLLRRWRRDPYNNRLKMLYIVESKLYKRLLKRKQFLFKKTLIDKLNCVEENNPTEFWKIVNDMSDYAKKSKFSCISTHEWKEYFSKLMFQINQVITQSDKNIEDIVKNKKHDVSFCELDFKITTAEILKAASSLKNKKSCARDRITSGMVKTCIPYIINILCTVFNKILVSGIYPTIWSESVLVPIHKKGSIKEPSNYRGICLSSSLGKLFCIIIHNRIKQFIKNNNLSNSYQIGFRESYRTSDHMMVLKSLIDKFIKKGKHLYVCFIDFQKCFDTVWRTGMLYKLISCNITGLCFNLIKNMYENTEICIKNGNVFSDKFVANVGVKQGCVLSPTLFKLYVDDLPSIFDINKCEPPALFHKYINCLLFADDLILLSESKTGLQNSLNLLKNYCDKWHLYVNIQKTNIIVFNKSGKIIKNCNFTFGDKNISIVKNYVYLGILFDASGSYKSAVKLLREKGDKVIYKIRNMIGHHSLDVKTNLKLFNSLVKPILLYGSEIWGSTIFRGSTILDINEGKSGLYDTFHCELTQNRMLRYILGVHRKSTNIAVKGELGVFPIFLDVLMNMVKNWMRIIDFDSDSLLYDSYLYALDELRENNSNSWLYIIRHLCKICGFEEYWFNQRVKNKSLFLRSVKEKLHSIYVEQWKLDLYNDNRSKGGNKLRTYRLFKKSFDLEPYLFCIKNKAIRNKFCQVRISAHNLCIESERGIKEPCERLCKLCKSDVENEIHFITDCHFYCLERERLYIQLYEIYPEFIDFNDEEKMKFILGCTDYDVLQLTSSYIFDIWGKRSELLSK